MVNVIAAAGYRMRLLGTAALSRSAVVARLCDSVTFWKVMTLFEARPRRQSADQ